jgi:hypothetical protein
MKPIEIIQDIFTNQLSVLNIAVPTSATSLADAKRICEENNYDVHLVSDATSNDLQLYFHNSVKQPRNLSHREVVSESTPIIDTLELLIENNQIFVKVKNEISYVVSKADIDTIPVRLWLFGMINLFEMELKIRIEKLKIPWEVYLRPEIQKSIDKAYNNKKKNNQDIDKLNCTNLRELFKVCRLSPSRPRPTRRAPRSRVRSPSSSFSPR